MDLDDQLRRYFGTSDLASVTPDALAAGTERISVDLGLEKDRSRRFALWVLLFMLGAAPDLDVAFKDEADREAARNFMDGAARALGD
ncbi:MAG TPA: hypothetical protein VIA98_09665 [Allosphingosinicella sp.]|jgi:hypothetical protein